MCFYRLDADEGNYLQNWLFQNSDNVGKECPFEIVLKKTNNVFIFLKLYTFA